MSRPLHVGNVYDKSNVVAYREHTKMTVMSEYKVSIILKARYLRAWPPNVRRGGQLSCHAMLNYVRNFGVKKLLK